MIYLIKVDYREVTLLKIGYAKSIKRRLTQYITENPLFELLDHREGDRRLEELLHDLFKEYKFEKGREWFYYDDYIVENFHFGFEESFLIERIKRNIDKVRSFSKKLRLYCEFKEKYPETTFIVDYLQKYINILGIEKCKELGYKENSLYKEICDSGFFEEFKNEEDRIVNDFLNNYFYKTGLFHEKMKLYCEFSDMYSGNSAIMEGLNHRIEDPKFLKYYRYYGTKGCSSRKYQEADLYRGWEDASKSDKLSSIIYSKYQTGDKISMIDLKLGLKEIYSSLSISKTAKATDLGEYFSLTKTHVTINGVSKNGFKLGEKLR
jgi:hypothetical protein